MEKIYESKFIECKPVSVNASHLTTKTFIRAKSKNYKKMEADCLKQLEEINLKSNRSYRIEYKFFLPRQGSDVDNFIKCFQDILESKIKEKDSNFDDNLFYEIEAKKYFPDMKKDGKTGIKFKIFEIKLKKEIDGMKLKKDKNLGAESYED